MTDTLWRRNAMTLLESLVVELASEIDLFYEDDDLVAARPAMQKMKRAVQLLNSTGRETPAAFAHLQQRFEGTRKHEELNLSQ